MKKVILIIVMMFFYVGFVFASNNLMIDVVSVSSDSVTLKIKDYDHSNNFCYLYKSMDEVNYDSQIILDCNKMYVDKEIESGKTYYYKVRYENDDDYSDVVSVFIDNGVEEHLKITRNVNELSLDGLGISMVIGILMTFVVIFLYLFRKKSI